MKLSKHISTLLLLLLLCAQIQAQSVRYADYWFNDDYDSLVRETVNGGKDYFWSRDIPTNLLPEGLHRVNVRFTDNQGNLSGITSQYFVKLNRQAIAYANVFEYWYGEDFQDRKVIPLGYSREAAIILNLEIDTLPKGFYQLNFRVGVKDGIYSPPTTDYFYKYTDAEAGASMLFEYWFDNNIELKKNVPIPINGLVKFDISAAELEEEGMHILYYRVGKSGGPYSAVSSSFFFKSREGAKVLECWFDGDKDNMGTISLNGKRVNIIADVNASHLNNGVHTIHFRSGYQDGTYSAETSSYFMKGENPYAPLLPSEGEQMITEYLFWFDNDIEADMRDNIVPTKTYTLDVEAEVPEHFKRGDHVFHIQFKDNYGQWGEMTTDTFRNLAGRVTEVSIKNLEPNINPICYQVRDLATIYRYYQIVDDRGEPVEGAIIHYMVEKKLKNGLSGGYSNFMSMRSDTNGLAIIAFDVFGQDTNDDNDDYVGLSKNGNPMGCICVTLNGDTLKILENDFDMVIIFVSEYLSEESTLSFELLAEVAGSVEFSYAIYKLQDAISGKAKIGIKTEKDFYGKIENTKHVYSGALKNKADFTMKTPTPHFYLSGNVSLEKIDKYEEELSPSILKAAYELLMASYLNSGSNDSKLFSLAKAIGHFLSADIYHKSETSSGVTMDGNLGVGFGKSNVSGINIDANIGKEMSFESGTSQEFINIYNTFTSNFVKMGIAENVELSAIYTSPNELTYGAGATVAQGSEVKVTRKFSDQRYQIEEGNIEITKGAKTDVKLVFMGVTGEIAANAEYEHKYTFKKPLFENANAFSINNPLWEYFNNREAQNFPNVNNINRDMDIIAAGLETNDPVLLSKINKEFEYKISKNFEAALGLSKEWETPNILGFQAKVKFGARVSNAEKYPIGAGYFDFTGRRLMPIVSYADLNKVAYWFDPINKFNNFWANMKDAIVGGWSYISDKASEYWSKFTHFLGVDDDEDEYVYMSNSDKKTKSASRKYANSLNSYKDLQHKRQKDVSTIEFFIPTKQQSFEYNTSIDLEWFYPGGELLGITEIEDTIIVISDLFFLKARHKWDTLSVAPNGDFKIYATVGDDDLSFLEIDQSYPVSVYYQSLDDTTNIWQLIGSVNDTIVFDKLGMYCLGVGVNGDDTPPAISITKEKDADFLNITITDNMAVFWKETFVLVNGLITEYQRNGSELTINLTEEQIEDDIYVTVYAKDLARNESSATAEFLIDSIVNIKEIQKEKQSVCILYPNPANSACNLVISDPLQEGNISMVVLSTLGQIVHKEKIVNKQTTFNIGHLADGVYFVVLFDDKGIISNKKLIKRTQ